MRGTGTELFQILGRGLICDRNISLGIDGRNIMLNSHIFTSDNSQTFSLMGI